MLCRGAEDDILEEQLYAPEKARRVYIGNYKPFFDMSEIAGQNICAHPPNEGAPVARGG